MGQPNILAIRLPADHPYYTVQRYNETHGTSFTYWPGGDAAPADWDGDGVLFRDGDYIGYPSPACWQRGYNGDPARYADADIIGYTKRTEAPQAWVPTADLMDRMVRLVRLAAAQSTPIDGPESVGGMARAIAALLPPEPVDPLLQRAREIVADECRGEAEAQSFRNGNRDGSVAVQAVLRALRQG